MLVTEVLNTGSKGNSFLCEPFLFDIGCSFEKIKKYIPKIKYICITHVHGDHCNVATLKTILGHRPSITIITNDEVANKLVDNGVRKNKILVIDKPLKLKNIGIIKKHEMVHDAKNFGYSIEFENGFKFAYLTDSGDISHIKLPNYSLVVLECNYQETIINAKIINAKNEEDWYNFNHLKRVKMTHLAEHQHNAWIEENAPYDVIKWHMSERNYKLL